MQPWDYSKLGNQTLKYAKTHIWSSILLKYRKVTKPRIEPRTFWTYTRCSNQLSYLVLECRTQVFKRERTKIHCYVSYMY